MKNVSIKHLQLFEDRSDAACRVVVKTIGSHRWEARRSDNDAVCRIATNLGKRRWFITPSMQKNFPLNGSYAGLSQGAQSASL